MINTTSPDKQEVLEAVEQHIRELGFSVVKKDFARPWGGFLVIDETQAEMFAQYFFPQISFSTIRIGKLSPKILIVQPNKRLSWQYHHRRSEIWKAIAGKPGVVTSLNDTEGEVLELNIGDIVQLSKGQRHRLVGLSEWGVLAEIWQHTDPSHPSDEDDIVRVQDDFGR